MKNKVYTLLIFILIIGCSELDLNPLSEASSENWYSDETEINMAIDDLYRINYWYLFSFTQLFDNASDNLLHRNNLTAPVNGTLNGQTNETRVVWDRSYQAISRANIILHNLNQDIDFLPEATLERMKAEVRFVRASMYARLVFYYGDVVYYDNILDIDEAFSLGRTDKRFVLEKVYEDFDFAIENLPLRYSNNEVKRFTKGAALAMKARTALYQNDFSIARDAAKACMDLGEYELYPDYEELFLSKTKNTKEQILSFSRSVELGVYLDYTRKYITRTSGGLAEYVPSWELLFSYLCTDGLPIDESPLFDPRNPFENRDPRCAATIVPFQTEHLGFIYQPHPDSVTVLNVNTGSYQMNNDTRSNTPHASYNGLVLKKGIDEDWVGDQMTDPDALIIRYADVLLMYAEAKIELGEIDQSVLDAINMVRARAYGVNPASTNEYPTVTETEQNSLRRILRMERRMELAFEDHRYNDLLRWRIAHKVMNFPKYGMLEVDQLKERIIEPGLWFFPGIPEIDEDGAPILKPFYEAGLIKLISTPTFDEEKNYLWPIPTTEVLINDNIKQNPKY